LPRSNWYLHTKPHRDEITPSPGTTYRVGIARADDRTFHDSSHAIWNGNKPTEGIWGILVFKWQSLGAPVGAMLARSRIALLSHL
jgi:hypothetical protein